jgi:hypothetical protein
MVVHSAAPKSTDVSFIGRGQPEKGSTARREIFDTSAQGDHPAAILAPAG